MQTFLYVELIYVVDAYVHTYFPIKKITGTAAHEGSKPAVPSFLPLQLWALGCHETYLPVSLAQDSQYLVSKLAWSSFLTTHSRDKRVSRSCPLAGSNPGPVQK